VKGVTTGFAKFVLLSIWYLGTFAYADLVTLKPTLYSVKVCNGQNFDVTFGGSKVTNIISKERLNISLARSSKGADNNSLSVVSQLIPIFQYFQGIQSLINLTFEYLILRSKSSIWKIIPEILTHLVLNPNLNFK